MVLSCIAAERRRTALDRAMSFSHKSACPTALAVELRRLANSSAQGDPCKPGDGLAACPSEVSSNNNVNIMMGQV
eukprot:8395384-Pyramimonas_sp.AAC.1